MVKGLFSLKNIFYFLVLITKYHFVFLNFYIKHNEFFFIVFAVFLQISENRKQNENKVNFYLNQKQEIKQKN